MRSINALEWHAGQEALPLNAVSLKNTTLVKSFKFALQVLFYVPYQFNRYLDSLDTAPGNYRKQVMHESRESLQSAKHQHITPRVWQRRSALITMLEEQQSATSAVEKQTNVTDLCQVQSTSEKTNCSSGSFNVLQVKCLPVWASNFSDIGMIEQELDFYNQVEQVKEAI